MIATILTVALALTWLMIETDWMTIRLPVGTFKMHDGKARTIAQWEEHDKVFEKEIEREQKEYAKQEAIKKSHTCSICNKYDENILVETKELHIGNSVCHVIGCPDCIAKYTKDVINSQILKPRQLPFKTSRLPSFDVYSNCLVPKSWLKKHEHDLDGYEPTIELSIDDKTLSVNGNYQKGMIGDFIKPYTKTVKAGKKSMTILNDQHVENMGGGVYIAVNN